MNIEYIGGQLPSKYWWWLLVILAMLIKDQTFPLGTLSVNKLIPLLDTEILDNFLKNPFQLYDVLVCHEARPRFDRNLQQMISLCSLLWSWHRPRKLHLFEAQFRESYDLKVLALGIFKNSSNWNWELSSTSPFSNPFMPRYDSMNFHQEYWWNLGAQKYGDKKEGRGE